MELAFQAASEPGFSSAWLAQQHPERDKEMDEYSESGPSPRHWEKGVSAEGRQKSAKHWPAP